MYVHDGNSTGGAAKGHPSHLGGPKALTNMNHNSRKTLLNPGGQAQQQYQHQYGRGPQQPTGTVDGDTVQKLRIN